MTQAGLAFDLCWGAEEIGKEIGRNRSATFHLLAGGQLPAKKVGGRWCASRQKLRALFMDEQAA
jgi:hypothetical protein